MGSATGRDVHVDKVLSQMALNYRPEGFIADKIFPVVTVQKQSDYFLEFSRADRLRREQTARAPGNEARRIEQSVTSGTYFARNYALKAAVTIEDKSNADEMFLSEIYNGRSQLIMDHLLLDWEIRIANQVTSTSNVGSSTAVTSAWDGAGDPLVDVNGAIDNVHFAQGIMPNRVLFGLEAWKSFRRDNTVRNLIFGNNNGGGYPNVAQVSELLDIPEVMVAGAFQNTGADGLGEALSTIWGDDVLVYYAPTAPSRERPSFGYAFRWARPGLPNMMIERHPFDSRRHAEELEAGYYQDEVITQAGYGFLINAVNSST